MSVSVFEHPFLRALLGDDAVAEGADRLDVARRTPEHFLRLATYGQDLVAAAHVPLDGDDGGLA